MTLIVSINGKFEPTTGPESSLATGRRLQRRQMKLSTFFSQHRWCQRTAARTEGGEPCEPDSPDAARWSLAGAILLLGDPAYDHALSCLVAELPSTTINAWNDAPGRTQAEVIAFCRKLNI